MIIQIKKGATAARAHWPASQRDGVNLIPPKCKYFDFFPPAKKRCKIAYIWHIFGYFFTKRANFLEAKLTGTGQEGLEANLLWGPILHHSTPTQYHTGLQHEKCRAHICTP